MAFIPTQGDDTARLGGATGKSSITVDFLGGIDTLDMGDSPASIYTIVKAGDGSVRVDTITSISSASNAVHLVLRNLEILKFSSGTDTLNLASYFSATNHLPTGVVSIAGTATQGKTLIAANTLADADGLGAIGYQWKAGGVNIIGATSSSFVLTEAQVGKAITVAASYTDQLGTAESVLSSATASVLKLSDPGTAGQIVDLLAYHWYSHILLNAVGLSAGSHSVTTNATGAAAWTAVTETLLLLTASRIVPDAEASATSLAVNLTDAIAILKMIVGLDVNGAGKPLSPYQLYAADFDGNGRVELSDAIAVLKHVVGLDAPKPNWTFFNEADTTVSSMLAQGKVTLSPGTAPALSIGASTVHLGLVGVLIGDVDGSYGGPVAAPALAPSYFVNLSVQDHLNLSQFGVYPA